MSAPPTRRSVPGPPGLSASLHAYVARRDFARTPEPRPAEGAGRGPVTDTRRRVAARGDAAPAGRPGPGPGTAARALFVVHKHHARRLHYDLRLEIGGVLASWAVPKGPSYDPAVRRLAVETEDHPLEYAEFEGRIPEGAYGAGDSLLWDRGTYETVPPGEAAAQRARGHLRIRLAGEKLRGEWHLIRTRSRQARPTWLLVKARDDTAAPGYEVTAARPESVLSGRELARGPRRLADDPRGAPPPEQLLAGALPVMLATPASAVPADPTRWVVEPKYDGFRVLGAVSGGRAALWSRQRQDLGARFPGLVAAVAGLPAAGAVLDGEVVALDARGVPRFEWLQAGRGTLVLVAFDLLHLDGEDLRGRPLEARRERLEGLLAGAPSAIRLAPRLDPAAGDVLRAAVASGFEGVVAKRRGSRYPGGRSADWLKVTVRRTQDVVVVGFLPLEGASEPVGALLTAVVEDGRLRFAGRVGTGFTRRQRAELSRLLAPDAVAAPPVPGAPRLPRATWVRPRWVAEVAFREWTADGLLRLPVFRRLRPDREPEDCVREGALVTLTHPDRVLYPRDGFTKRDVAEYYARVAGPLLRALADRPVTLEHFTEGIDRPSWFQQTIRHPEPWMTLVELPARPGAPPAPRLLVDRPETLTWLAQHAALTVHMWAARAASPESPDWVVFDLDPAEGTAFALVVEVALVLRGLFERLGLPSVPKTSGRRGLHVLVPLAPGHTHEAALAFARQVGAAVVRLLPEVTLERTRRRRGSRLYLDCLQNGYGKTLVAPYSLRAADGAPVSTPLRWSEVTPALDPSRFTLRTLPARLDRVGDLFAPALAGGGRLPPLE